MIRVKIRDGNRVKVKDVDRDRKKGRRNDKVTPRGREQSFVWKITGFCKFNRIVIKMSPTGTFLCGQSIAHITET